MKRLSILLAVCLAAVTAIVAQPRIKWLELVHNYGAFDENDGKVTCSMRFVNTGTRPLQILAARATCGCTTPSFTRKPVEPGDTGEVLITYNPIGRPGRFSKKVFVDTNTMPSQSILEVKGVVVGSSNTVRSRFPVDAGPLKLRASVTPFGQITKGHSKSTFIDVYNSTAEPVKPQWRNIPPYLGISAGAEEIAPGDYGSFTFYFASDKSPLYGVVTDEVTLVPDPATPNDTVNVSIVAILNEDFSSMSEKDRENAPVIGIIPEYVDFDVIKRADGIQQRKVTVKNYGNSTMIVRRIYCDDKGISAEISNTKIKKGKTATLTVTVNPEEMEGDVINARIPVITNSPDNPVVSLRVVGVIK